LRRSKLSTRKFGAWKKRKKSVKGRSFDKQEYDQAATAFRCRS
jgi:hypothetical protein